MNGDGAQRENERAMMLLADARTVSVCETVTTHPCMIKLCFSYLLLASVVYERDGGALHAHGSFCSAVLLLVDRIACRFPDPHILMRMHAC